MRAFVDFACKAFAMYLNAEFARVWNSTPLVFGLVQCKLDSAKEDGSKFFGLNFKEKRELLLHADDLRVLS